MTVYAIAQLTITDPETYARYQARFMEVFNRFAGTLLAVDDNVQVIEGGWEHKRLVLISFPGEASFRAWFDSTAYQTIAEDRWIASIGDIVLAQGLPNRS